MIELLVYSIFTLFLPGFMIVSLFHKDSSTLEKICLSFGLSTASVVLMMFHLNYFLKFPIDLQSILLIDTLIFLASLAVILKRCVTG
jgi:uncharacterized membrane protein